MARWRSPAQARRRAGVDGRVSAICSQGNHCETQDIDGAHCGGHCLDGRAPRGCTVCRHSISHDLRTRHIGQPDHSAGFYPENTYAYVSLDAKPTLGNIGELVKLRDGFGDAELLKDFIDDLRGGVSEDSGIELEQVSPWIGFRHSAGVTDAGVIGIIGVRNRDRAAEFIPVLIEQGLRRRRIGLHVQFR